MTEEEARALAQSLNQRPGIIAIATTAHEYGVFPATNAPKAVSDHYARGRKIDHMPANMPWIVVANGTVIRSRKELAP